MDDFEILKAEYDKNEREMFGMTTQEIKDDINSMYYGPSPHDYCQSLLSDCQEMLLPDNGTIDTKDIRRRLNLVKKVIVIMSEDRTFGGKPGMVSYAILDEEDKYR